MEKNNFVKKKLPLIILVVIILGVGLFAIYKSNLMSTPKLEENNNNGQNIEDEGIKNNNNKNNGQKIYPPYDEITYNSYSNYLVAKKNEEYFLIDFDNNVIDQSKHKIDTYGSGYGAASGDYYDGYYSINGLVKRNGKEVKKISSNEFYDLYKDTTDEKSLYYVHTKYIKYVYVHVVLNDKYAIIGIEDYNTGETPNLQVKKMNLNTGKEELSKNFKGYFYYEYNNKNTEYFVIMNYNGVSDLDVIINNNNLEPIISTEYNAVARYGSTDMSFRLDNSKYITIKKDNKSGIMDHNGQIIIPLNYDDILSNEYSENFVVIKNGKYGLIDINGKERLPVEYDAIEIIQDYVIIIKDKTLSILDMNLSRIHNFDLINKIEDYYPRGCIGCSSGFVVIDNDNYIYLFIYNLSPNNFMEKIIYLMPSNNKYIEIEAGFDDKKINDYMLFMSKKEVHLYDKDCKKILAIPLVNSSIYSSNIKYIDGGYIEFAVKLSDDNNYKYYYLDINMQEFVDDVSNKKYILYGKNELLNKKYIVTQENDKLYLYENDKLIKAFNGKDIIHLKDNYYRLKTIDDNYQVIKF